MTDSFRDDQTSPVSAKDARAATESPAATGSPVPTWRRFLALVAPVLLPWIIVLTLHLTPAMFAALATIGATRALSQRLRARWPRMKYAEACALVVIVLILVAVIALIVEFSVDMKHAWPKLVQQMVGVLEQMRTGLPPVIANHVPPSLDALRESIVHWLREHAPQVQAMGGHTLRALGHVIAGLVIGTLVALQITVRPARRQMESRRAGPLSMAIRGHFDDLERSFTDVVFAQVRISAINTALTAVFVLGILPLVGRPLPLAPSLIMLTFIAGLVPVVGNLVSNTVIVLVAMSNSALDGGLALAWLVGIHKLEYFLNAHIIGTRIRSDAWELLIAMLVMEATFGIAGLVSAPIIYAQLKRAMFARGWIRDSGAP